MRRYLSRAFALTALLALSSSWVVGWSVALHLARADHHLGGSSHHGGALDLEMALHGHAHAEGTPAHGHPVLGSVAAPLPGKLLLMIGAMIGEAPEVVVAESSSRQLLSPAGPTHDPPPHVEAVAVLRI